MAKLTKEEFKSKINEKISDSDLAIELLEDIEDSMNEVVDMSADVERLTAEVQELKDKYKARFLDSTDKKEADDDTFEEKKDEVIDIKEI